MEFIRELDHAILYFINGFALKSWSLDIVVQLLERNDLTKGALLVSVYWFLWFSGKDEQSSTDMRKSLVASIAGSMAGVLFTVFLTAVLPFRLRPLHNPEMELSIPADLEKILQGMSAFPSDTATLIGGLVTGIFIVSKTAGMLSMLYAFSLVLIPRVFLGLHYPTDIMAGALVGVSFVVLMNRPGVRDALSSQVLQLAEKHPYSFYGVFFLLTYELGSLFLDLREMGNAGWLILKAVSNRIF